MRGIVLTVLFSAGWFTSASAVEIYSAGRYFDSIEEYKKDALPVSLRSAYSPDDLPEPAVDEPPDPQQERVKRLTYDHAVSHVVAHFEQDWKSPRPRFIAGSKELERVIEKAMRHQKKPSLIIADQKKIRILAYDAKTDRLVEAGFSDMDKTVNK